HVPPLPAAAPARPAAAAHAAGRRRAAGPPRAVAAHPHRAPRGGEPGDRPARAGRGFTRRTAARGAGRERQVGHRDREDLGRRRRTCAAVGARGARRGAVRRRAGCGQGRNHRRAAPGLLGAAELLAVPQDADGDPVPPAAHRRGGRPAAQGARRAGAGARTLYKRLAAGGTVGILPDQKPRAGEGEFAPFFGRDALTMVLLPRLAARTGAAVLYAFAERLPQGAGYRIHILPAPDGLADADLGVACTALNRGVEACVDLAFSQYQWQYKRWSAHDRPSPYDTQNHA